MDKSSLRLSVISFNILGTPFAANNLRKTLFRTKLRERLRTTAHTLNESNADIISLQEVVTYYHLRALKKHLHKYPYVIYEPFLFGPKGGCVVFSKVPISQFTYIPFDKKGTWTNITFYGKVIRCGTLIVKVKDYPILIVNSHLIANFDFDWSYENRFTPYIAAQLTQLSQVIRDFGKRYSLIATGDYNTDRNSDLYKRFVQSTDVLDALDQIQTPTLRDCHAPKGKKGVVIDYIFYKNPDHINVLKSAHILQDAVTFSNGKQYFLSDHVGLQADFLFRFAQTTYEYN